MRLERDDLPGGMHPGIGAPGDDQLYRLPEDDTQSFGECSFDRSEVRLGSPAGEIRSVVLHEPGEFRFSCQLSALSYQLPGGEPYPAKITPPP